MSFCKPFVAGTSTEAVLLNFTRYFFFYSLHNIATKFHKFVVKIAANAEFKGGCGRTTKC